MLLIAIWWDVKCEQSLHVSNQVQRVVVFFVVIYDEVMTQCKLLPRIVGKSLCQYGSAEVKGHSTS